MKLPKKKQWWRCQCEDSNGKLCHKKMTEEEYKQDGMCSVCAEHVYKEMRMLGPYYWSHAVEL